MSLTNKVIDVSIIIINYNTFDMTCNCIQSVIDETKSLEYEIILVDNNSTKEDPALFKQKFPGIKLIAHKENIGFAGGNNLGLKIAKGNFVLLLNSDTVILNNSIYKCLNFLRNASPEIGVVGCKLLNSDLSLQESTAGNQPKYYSFGSMLWDELKDSNPIFSKLSVNKKSNSKPIDNNQLYSQIFETDNVIGAFMLIRKEVLDKVGWLDVDFFMYYEEIEWCSRVVKNKYKIFYYPFAEIIHLGGKSGGGANMKPQMMISKSLLFKKIFGVWGVGLYVLATIFNAASNIIVFPFLRETTKKSVLIYLKNCFKSLPQMLEVLFLFNKDTSSSGRQLRYKSLR